MQPCRFCDRVTVRVKGSGELYTFECQQWFDSKCARTVVIHRAPHTHTAAAPSPPPRMREGQGGSA